MNKEKSIFSDKKLMLKDIIATLENDFDELYSDFHFSTENYGATAGIEELEKYGVRKAIEECKKYEKEHLGEVVTDLRNNRAVSYLLYYIKSYEFLFYTINFNNVLLEVAKELNLEKDLWNEVATEEVNKAIVKHLKENF